MPRLVHIKGGRTQLQHPCIVQMQLQNRKIDLELFKERAEALQQAGVALEEGITASRAQQTSDHDQVPSGRTALCHQSATS